MDIVTRVPPDGSDEPLGGVELSDARLDEVVAAVHNAGAETDGEARAFRRFRLQGVVTITPIGGGNPRRVGVYDVSRAGIAVVDSQEHTPGERFNLHIERAGNRPIEVLCTVRHCRAWEQVFIIGTEYGVSWLAAVGAMIASVGTAPKKVATLDRSDTVRRLPSETDAEVLRGA